MIRSKKAAKSPDKLANEALQEAAKIHIETIQRHAEEARADKLNSEKVRLGTRNRLTRLLLPTVVKEVLAHRNGGGIPPSARKIAEACENASKLICKTLALEHSKQEGSKKE